MYILRTILFVKVPTTYIYFLCKDILSKGHYIQNAGWIENHYNYVIRDADIVTYYFCNDLGIYSWDITEKKLTEIYAISYKDITAV